MESTEAIKEGIGRIPDLPSDERLNLSKGLVRINEICNSLLRKEKIDNSLIKIVDVISYTQDVIQEVQSISHLQTKIEFDHSAVDASEASNLLFDPARFKRTLSNLINNSLEATFFQGRILVSIQKNTVFFEIIRRRQWCRHLNSSRSYFRKRIFNKISR